MDFESGKTITTRSLAFQMLNNRGHLIMPDSGPNEFILVNNKCIATESKQMVPDHTAPLGAV